MTASASTMTPEQAALAGWDAGLSMLLVRQDGSKQPGGLRIHKWKRRQTRRCTRRALERLYRRRGLTGVGFATGKVSGHVRLFEFDDRATYTAFLDAAERAGLAELVARIRAGYEEATPGNGIHWLARCPVEGGNTPLARRPAPTERNPRGVKTLIETREDGGYVITAPSNGRVHPSGGAYRLLSGGFDTIANLTPEEWDDLRTLARTFDEMPAQERKHTSRATNQRPGDEYNRRATWREVLEPHGWRFLYERGGISYWRRPDKDRGISATTNGKGTDTLHVFSTSTVFEVSPTSYDKFGAFALLAHGGDFAAAAAALAGQQPRAETVFDDDPPRDEPPSSAEPRTISEVVAVVRRWMHLPDAGIVYANLGAIAANLNRHDPTPVWLGNVGASSGGKTEVMMAAAGLPFVRLAATITEAGLLSGTSKRERAGDAKGGLLREIGAFGILLLKDFTSVLSMNRDARAALFAALREIYDGSWVRTVGIDGGRSFSWQGKLGLIFACTTAIDSHHAAVSAMGERFVFYRLPHVNPTEQAARALANAGHEAEMRREMSEAVSGLFAGLSLPDVPPAISEEETRRLIALAILAARCRSAVERDGRTREIDLVHDAEAPARLAGTLRRLYSGMVTIGVEQPEAWRVIVKVAFDCLPKIRRAVLAALVRANDWTATNVIAAEVRHPTLTTRRALEDMHAHGVVERQLATKAGTADTWRLSLWAIRQYTTATASEMSAGHEHGTGTASEMSEEGEEQSPFYTPDTTSEDFSDAVPPPFYTPDTTSEDFSDAVPSSRATSCWRCKSPLTDEGHEPCGECGWLRCDCGACEQGCASGRFEVS